MPLIDGRKDTKKIVLVGMGTSLFLEIIQLISGIGTFDVDDLILNTFGTILGYIFLNLVTRFFKLDCLFSAGRHTS